MQRKFILVILAMFFCHVGANSCSASLSWRQILLNAEYNYNSEDDSTWQENEEEEEEEEGTMWEENEEEEEEEEINENSFEEYEEITQKDMDDFFSKLEETSTEEENSNTPVKENRNASGYLVISTDNSTSSDDDGYWSS